MRKTPPSDASLAGRRAVDLTALDTFIEFKRRIGTAAGFNPDPANVAQIDEYLELSKADGKGVRTGILTDGKHWLLRWPEAGPVRTAPPYGFVLESAEQWLPLYEWLRDRALLSLDRIKADRANVEQYLGPASPAYQRDIDALARLYADAAGYENRARQNAACGRTCCAPPWAKSRRKPSELDNLFIRHTYLSLVIGMAVQASFGIGPAGRWRPLTRRTCCKAAASATPPDSAASLNRTFSRGRTRWAATTCCGRWPGEWRGLTGRTRPPDIAAILYETVIPPEERRTLGEYYTPAWLARAMVRELVDDPINQSVLDPACGSGTFIAEAVRHFLAAAGNRQNQDFRDYGIDRIGDAGNPQPFNPENPNNPVNPDSDNPPNLDPKELLDRLPRRRNRHRRPSRRRASGAGGVGFGGAAGH